MWRQVVAPVARHQVAQEQGLTGRTNRTDEHINKVDEDLLQSDAFRMVPVIASRGRSQSFASVEVGLI